VQAAARNSLPGWPFYPGQRLPTEKPVSELSVILVANDPAHPDEGGYYAVDDQHRRVLGPYQTIDACKEAIDAAIKEKGGNVRMPAGAIGAGGTP
jgi:hypothetical protein